MVVRTCAKDSCGSHMTYCTDARYWVVEFIIDDSLTIVNLLQIVYTMQGVTFALACLPWQVHPCVGQVDFKTHWSEISTVAKN